jgi:hypothetical protein
MTVLGSAPSGIGAAVQLLVRQSIGRTVPIVAHLIYDLILDQHIVLKHRGSIVLASFDAFSGELENGVLLLRPGQPFTTIEDARSRADSDVRAWEISLGLAHALQTPPQFRFRSAEFRPDHGSPSSDIQRVSAGYGSIKVAFTVKKEFDSLPPPPAAFSVTPTVESLWLRYQGALRDREPLPAMAYFVFTVLQDRFDGRKNIGKALHVSRNVVEQLGRISSHRGDTLTARKAVASTSALSNEETIWLRTVTGLLIHRLAEHEAGHQGSLVEMTDLPPIAGAS